MRVRLSVAPRAAAIARRLVLSCALVLLCCSCRPASSDGETPRKAAADPWFEETARAASMTFEHRSGHKDRCLFPEIMGGGACLIDYDADGFLDVYLVQSGALVGEAAGRGGNVLYHNRGDGTFDDVTASAGVGGTAGYGMGCTVGDVDGDTRPDLYITNVGPNILYRNRGDGTFEDVTKRAGVGDPSWSTSATFLDYDGDHDLDLFIANYVSWSIGHELACTTSGGKPDYCHPRNYNAPAADVLYRNNGDGTFADVSAEAGLSAADGTGLGVVAGDFNLDGRTDLYVANDGMPNQLWINRGGGRFSDEALLSGAAVNVYGKAEAGMGLQAVDADYDGDLDLFITHLREEKNTLYVNRGGAHQFDDGTAASGLGAPSLPYTGFGLAMADYNNDGLLDCFVANGRVRNVGRQRDPKDPYAEENLLFEGVAPGRFKEFALTGGTREPLIATSRGLAAGDLDNDGDVDLVVVNRDGPVHLLRNVAGAKRSWVMFRVLDERGGDALGAMVTITAGGRRQTRLVHPNYGYCSSNDPRAHFGLGDAGSVEEVSVRWADGMVDAIGGRKAGEVHVIRRGQP